MLVCLVPYIHQASCQVSMSGGHRYYTDSQDSKMLESQEVGRVIAIAARS
jgi:hypothetical protein